MYFNITNIYIKIRIELLNTEHIISFTNNNAST